MTRDNSRSPSMPTYLSEEKKLAWLRLIRSENIGPITFHTLMNRFGSATNVLDALPELCIRGHLNRVITIFSQDDARREIDHAGKMGLRLIAMGEPEYPVQLLATEGAPPLLYAAGDISLLNRRFVAVVGSRNCSALGHRITRIIVSGFAQATPAFAIVSGMARGIDSTAHDAALSSGSCTAAVLAGGANIIYPPENKKLYERLLSEGVIISESPPDLEPRRRDFPRRNRIISGMALGIVVTEANIRSGSLITARLAAEQGREVFAIPGSPLDPRSEGTNALIREGATLVRSTADILEALTPLCDLPPPQITLPLEENAYQLSNARAEFEQLEDTDREKVRGALGPTPVEMDEIIRYTALPVEIVQVALLEMELAGCILRYHGGRIAYIAT